MRFQFIKTALVLVLVLALLLAYPMYAWATPEVMRAVIASAVIAFLNTLLGVLSIEYSIDKSNKVFMSMVLGGMGVRMGLILVALTILLLNKYHALALSLSLMGFYVTFLIAELWYVMKELTRRKVQDKKGKAGGRNLALRTISVEHRSS